MASYGLAERDWRRELYRFPAVSWLLSLETRRPVLDCCADFSDSSDGSDSFDDQLRRSVQQLVPCHRRQRDSFHVCVRSFRRSISTVLGAFGVSGGRMVQGIARRRGGSDDGWPSDSSWPEALYSDSPAVLLSRSGSSRNCSTPLPEEFLFLP